MTIRNFKLRKHVEMSFFYLLAMAVMAQPTLNKNHSLTHQHNKSLHTVCIEIIKIPGNRLTIF